MKRAAANGARPGTGFTLIEVVLTLVVVAILGGTVMLFLSGPVRGYMQTRRRAALVAAAGTALAQMARDIHAALPNSIRTTQAGGVEALELIHVLAGGRYRAGPGGAYTAGGDILQFNRPDADFNIEGHLGLPGYPYTSSTDRLVIYNVGVPGADAYANANVITPAGDTLTITEPGSEDHVHLATAFQFAYRSPGQRIYLVDTPVSWLCDPTAGTLRRYSGYPIGSVQPVDPSRGNLAAARVSACGFQYQPGTASRAGLVTLSLTLTDRGESVRLLQQVHVLNVP